MLASLQTRIQPAGSRFACITAVSLVFLTGVITGAVGMNLGLHRYIHRSSAFWTDSGKEVWLQRWQKELDLTPQQSREMAVILDDFGTYYRNILGDGKARILRILNDEQKRKFDKLLDAQR